MEQPRRVRVGPFEVDDLSYSGVLERLVEMWQAPRDRPYRAYALHVGGLNARADTTYQAAMSAADLVYADGISLVLLARLAGARRVQRTPTTDLGHDLLDRLVELEREEGRRLRVALLGGPPGLAAKAGDALSVRHGVEVVSTTHGYHDDWAGPLKELRNTGADLVFVGLGTPREQLYTEERLLDGPQRLVLTCGGWFGFLVGDERRAPRSASHLGLEWLWRLAQDPWRLAGRYLIGAWSTLRLGCAILLARRRGV